MAEGTYEHACMRAELLGLEKPDEDDFYKHSGPPKSIQTSDADAAHFEDISLQNDDLQHTSGGLSELNSILSGTQKKLNKLKGMYGSLSDLLKNKLGGSKDNMSYSTDPSYVPMDKAGTSSGQQSQNAATANEALTQVNRTEAVGSELHQQINSQVDKLDSLLAKAENAQYSMEHQNKQMKRFLNK